MTPLQAAARLALLKKTLIRKHCMIVAMVKISRKKKTRTGSL